MRQKLSFRRMLALLLVITISSTTMSCGGKTQAASMKLRKTEGEVAVEDSKGKTVTPEEEMNLYSGYLVGTRKESYAWIDLDRVKLTKVDARSEVEIQKKRDKLEIIVNSGNLFFNITEPLEDNETLDIRSSSMVVGIRGTCGWVEVEDDSRMRVYILEGKVKCSIPSQDSVRGMTTSVSAGEMAEMTISGGEADIAVEEIAVDQIPDFVMEELEDDEELYERILEDSGLDVWEDSEAEDAVRVVPENIVYYGDRSQCRMTSQQASAYAEVIRQEIDELRKSYEDLSQQFPSVVDEIRSLNHYAALVDTGGGNVALMAGGGAVYNLRGHEAREDGAEFAYCSCWGIWQYLDGRAVEFAGAPSGWQTVKLYPGHLLEGGSSGGDPNYLANAYVLGNGSISTTPSTIGSSEWEWANNGWNTRFLVDQREVTEAEYDNWRMQWDGGQSLAGYDHGTDISSRVWGLGSAEDMLTLLDSWADGGEEARPEEPEGISDGISESISYEDSPASDYRTTVSYDPATRIRHVDVDPQGYPLEIYHEIPVFEEKTAGYQKINRFFRDMEQDFFNTDETMKLMVEYAANPVNPNPDITYSLTWSAEITAETAQIVSVHMGYFWFAGGTTNYGDKNFVFDPETGEQLKITDLIDGSEEEIRKLVQDALRADLGDNESMIWSGSIEDYSADQFDFYVSNGRVRVGFDKYEIAAGAAGSFDVELAAALKRY